MLRAAPRAVLLAAATATAVAAAGALTTLTASAAAAGCRVDYRVTNQWTGGFGADVTVTNLGDPVNGWTLTWSYAAGQQVTQAWNATVTQSGTQVTARNVDHNATIGTNASANFGFNGSWTGSNPVPTSFALNGTTCTGATTPNTPP
ncbi:cellulose-binding domain-containing protein, partial [Micromonospora endophytica]